MLRLDLDKWQGGTLLVMGDSWEQLVPKADFHKNLLIRPQSLELLTEWETTVKYILVRGSPGIGKSSLAQLALARVLALGRPVVYHYSEDTWLLQYNNLQHILTERK